jgi:hypothetical protein
MDVKEIGWDCVDWIHLDQDRVPWWAPVNTKTNLWGPQKAGNILSSCATFSQGLCCIELVKKKSPWLWSASELCRPSDRRFLAK